MPDPSGFTRTVVTLRYALLTPDGFVPSVLPGWKHAVVVVNISPALGARFTQLHVTLAAEGTGEGNTGPNQYFIYVIEGSGTITLPDKRHRLEAGSYVYLPPGTDMQIKSAVANLRLVVFQKRYEPLPDTDKPGVIVAHEREVKGQLLPGNGTARAQALLPNNLQFDLAVNILTCQPGAAPPVVETPSVERGVFLLKGQGTYRLDSDRCLVQAGDAIWMAPYCPQWFVATGQTAASHLCYQDVNRDPM
jgi:(S)-ureidoglycine aminohydrolase